MIQSCDFRAKFCSWKTRQRNAKSVGTTLKRQGRETNIMFNSSAAGWFWCAAFSSCYPQTRRHVRGVEQRPHPTKHKDLLLYCYSTVKASLAHLHFPGVLTRAGWRAGLFHGESKWLCGTQTPVSTPSIAPVAATSSIVEALASPVALQRRTNAMISTLNPRCCPPQSLQCPPVQRQGPSAPPLPHLDYCTNPFTSF